MVTQQKATQIIILCLLILDTHTQHDTMTSNTVITPTKAHDTTMYIVVFSSRNEEAVREKNICNSRRNFKNNTTCVII